jgi:hypothetical protein
VLFVEQSYQEYYASYLEVENVHASTRRAFKQIWLFTGKDTYQFLLYLQCILSLWHTQYVIISIEIRKMFVSCPTSIKFIQVYKNLLNSKKTLIQKKENY